MTELLIKNIISEILFDNRVTESIEDQWIVDYLYENLMLERLLYGQPLTVPELRVLLNQKILNFQFIKLDGEIRDAKGTTMMKYVPQDQHPKGIRPSSHKVATFYDLDKMDWRSVSQRSKEIVLKKDEETGKPIVMVKDKPEVGDVAVRTKEPEKVPEIPTKEPIITPQKPVQPEVTIDNQPYDQVFPKKPPVKVEKVKPVESTERKETFHFVNPKTGASKDVEMTPKEMIKDLKKLGVNWKLRDENEFIKKEKEIEKAAEKAPEELGDILRRGDIRNYLNNKGENVVIEIVAEDPEGGFYARTLGGGTFKIPAYKMQNIGQKIESEEKTKPTLKGIINKEEDLDNTEASDL